MDIFTLDTKGTAGKVVNGLDDVIWTERYLKAGEFKATTTDLSLGLELPLGTYISHDETLEIVKILDHQIIKERGSSARLIITGDTLEKPLLDSRISIPSQTGYRNKYDDSANSYVYAENSSWVHAQYLIEGHLTGDLEILPGYYERVPGVECVQEVLAVETPLLQREIERGQVYDQVIKLLAIGNCGLKVRRPIENNTNIEIVIYRGTNRSSEVSISANMDQVDSASYLFSIRQKKTIAYVSGKWSYLLVALPGTPGLTTNPLENNWLHVDASDIEFPEYIPGGPPNNDVIAYNKLLQARGFEALAQHREVDMLDVTPYNLLSHDYNITYGMGDIIGVSGEYGGKTHLRVEEFTWAKDKNGVEHYPTFGTVDPSEVSAPTG